MKSLEFYPMQQPRAFSQDAAPEPPSTVPLQRCFASRTVGVEYKLKGGASSQRVMDGFIFFFFGQGPPLWEARPDSKGSGEAVAGDRAERSDLPPPAAFGIDMRARGWVVEE